jgi:isoleucyl-tRNA synthetase
MGKGTKASTAKSRFREVSPKVDFLELEHRILKFWEEGQFLKALMERNRGGPRWSFIDGPITANNPMGVHHAWGRTYKDLYQRFKAMEGYDQRFQNGFDCQGLWLEVETERDLGFNSKTDIERYGLDKFSRACRARVDKFSGIQTQQSIRLGQWMDWENSYYTMSDGNIEAIWHFLSVCHRKGWLYQGHHSMPWCVRCGTSLSQHELADTYEETEDRTVTLRFPLLDAEKESLLVWTTTPWTLTSNVAAAVHPELDYARVRYGDEILYLSAGTVEKVFKGKSYEILGTVKGKELVGRKYRGPFDDLPVAQGMEHPVIPWDEVSEEEGTGIVHIAPGCGAEDFALGKQHGLPRLEPIDGSGYYVEGFGWLTGMHVFDVEKPIIEDLKKKGLLFDTDLYRHRYPYCWRCKEKLVFRVEDEWFIWCDEIRPLMKEEARKVRWVPESVGKRTQDWYDNMGDWCISRKRYWGLPLPFYMCPRGHLTVVGSVKQLRDLAVNPEAVEALPELHRPWIDEVKIRCQGGPVRTEDDLGVRLADPEPCDEVAVRIRDVGDCWLDAGIVAFSTLKYFEDRSYWEKWFPADLVIEMREQVRLWFYAMMFTSVTLEGRAPYKAVYAYEKVHDEKGEPMHKSKGNAIWFDEAVERMGADVMRWLYCSANPRQILRFGYGVADEVRRHLITLWNVYSFFTTYAGLDGFDPVAEDAVALKVVGSNPMDRWILSSFYTLVRETRPRLEAFDVDGFMRRSAQFLDELSTWYIRRSRRRFWKSESDEDKRQAHRTLYHVLLGYVRLMAPVIPFVTEEIYQNLSQPLRETPDPEVVRALDPAGREVPRSVHLTGYPKERSELVDEELNRQMEAALAVVSLGRAAREKARVKVRQPLRRVRVLSLRDPLPSVDTRLLEEVREELNVKECLWGQGRVEDYATPRIRLNYPVLGERLGARLKEVDRHVKAGAWRLEEDGLVVGDDGGFRLQAGEYSVEYEAKEGYGVAHDLQRLVVVDLALEPELIREGWARETVRRIQDLRKKAGYHVADRIRLSYRVGDGEDAEEIRRMMEEHGQSIAGEVLAVEVEETENLEDTDASAKVPLGKSGELWVGVRRL